MIKLATLFIAISLLMSISKKGLSQCPLNLGQIPSYSTSGMTLYFPFNGNLNNQGNGNYTAIKSGANYTSGICGQAMEYDGIDDYVKLNPFFPLTGSFTIATWIYMDTLQPNQAIFVTRDQCPYGYFGYSQGEFYFYYNSMQYGGNFPYGLNYNVNKHQNCTNWSGGDRYVAQNFTFNKNTWYFVAITVTNNSTENRILNFYINCQHHSSSQYLNHSTSSSFNPNNNNKTYIGASSNVTNYYYDFNGKIDEFRLYNRVLSQQELYNIYKQCKPLSVVINKYTMNCFGDSAIIELQNTDPNVQYQLFDSTNQQFIGSAQSGGCSSLFFHTGLVTSPTDYYLKATNSSCTLVLDTAISLNPSSGGGYILKDTISICEGDSALIRGKYYSPPALAVDSLVDINGCDSILSTQVLGIPLPNVNLGNDTSYCDGDSILLQIGHFNSILWSTGDTTNYIFASKPGNYWVIVSDTANCSNGDTIGITNLSTTFIDILDTSFCEDESWTIRLPSANTYQWYNGSTNNIITISDSGDYWVEITDICKSYTDSFAAHTMDCNCMMAVPNVFTPNGDGLNDYFYPVISCIFDEYHIVIYNRWGQLLFESFDQDEKWDGRYKGSEVPEGVYFYLIRYKHLLTSDKERQRSGSITLFR